MLPCLTPYDRPVMFTRPDDDGLLGTGVGEQGTTPFPAPRRSSPPAAANSGWRNFTEAHSSRCVLLFSSRTWPVAVLRSRPHDGGPDQPSETVADHWPSSQSCSTVTFRPSTAGFAEAFAGRASCCARAVTGRRAPDGAPSVFCCPSPVPSSEGPPGGPPPARMHRRPRLADGGASSLDPGKRLVTPLPLRFPDRDFGKRASRKSAYHRHVVGSSGAR